MRSLQVHQCTGSTLPDLLSSTHPPTALGTGVVTDPDLADAYYNQAKPVVMMRLAQGGVRLAATLNYALA